MCMGTLSSRGALTNPGFKLGSRNQIQNLTRQIDIPDIQGRVEQIFHMFQGKIFPVRSIFQLQEHIIRKCRQKRRPFFQPPGTSAGFDVILRQARCFYFSWFALNLAIFSKLPIPTNLVFLKDAKLPDRPHISYQRLLL